MQITCLLVAWSEGDPEALKALTPLIYDQMRLLAARHMRRESGARTLQTTGLVHEAFLRLVDQKLPHWQSRSHFFSIASNIMRRILVDEARARLAAKRGGGLEHVSIDAVQENVEGVEGPVALQVAGPPDESGTSADIVAIDCALAKLDRIDRRQAQIVELRFFGGLTVEETGQVLNISNATVKRDWMMAKAWLAREMTESGA
ncbi:MAG: sigma-70 family RNA polymerase sigma factor [Proteobacteria bacterium]|nr:sigma-70 family RNA polymerase sigma factor [Pseudomonadota bacterium]